TFASVSARTAGNVTPVPPLVGSGTVNVTLVDDSLVIFALFAGMTTPPTATEARLNALPAIVTASPMRATPGDTDVIDGAAAVVDGTYVNVALVDCPSLFVSSTATCVGPLTSASRFGTRNASDVAVADVGVTSWPPTIKRASCPSTVPPVPLSTTSKPRPTTFIARFAPADVGDIVSITGGAPSC